jgi:hypothetical protein
VYYTDIERERERRKQDRKRTLKIEYRLDNRYPLINGVADRGLL